MLKHDETSHEVMKQKDCLSICHAEKLAEHG